MENIPVDVWKKEWELKDCTRENWKLYFILYDEKLL